MNFMILVVHYLEGVSLHFFPIKKEIGIDRPVLLAHGDWHLIPILLHQFGSNPIFMRKPGKGDLSTYLLIYVELKFEAPMDIYLSFSSQAPSCI